MKNIEELFYCCSTIEQKKALKVSKIYIFFFNFSNMLHSDVIDLSSREMTTLLKSVLF